MCGASGPRNRAQPLVDHALTLLGPELALRDAEIVPASKAKMMLSIFKWHLGARIRTSDRVESHYAHFRPTHAAATM